MADEITPAMIQAAQDLVQGPDEDMYTSIYRAMRGAAPVDPKDERIAALEAFVANVAERHHSSDHYSLATAFERFQTRARALTQLQQEA